MTVKSNLCVQYIAQNTVFHEKEIFFFMHGNVVQIVLCFVFYK